MTLSPEEFERRAKITADNCVGITPHIEVFFISSILYSAERSLEAFSQYDQLIDSDASPAELVSSVQEAVIHAAAVSRYFWPSPMGKKKEPEFNRMKTLRGEKLREAFELGKDSALYDRDLRNAWEHFDERIDKYFLTVTAGEFFPDPLLGSHMLADNPVQHFLKLLDVDAHCLVLLDARYYYDSIRIAIGQVTERAIMFLNNGSRLLKNT